MRSARYILTGNNPFLIAQEQLNYDYEAKRGRIKPGRMLEIKVLLNPESIPIYTAKEADTWNPEHETASDEKNSRAIAACLYSRTHHVDNNTLLRFILPAHLNKRFGAKQSLIRTIIDAGDQWQACIMKFFRVGVRLVVNSMGGLKIWQDAGRAERVRMYGKLFDMNPLNVAYAAWGPVARYVPLGAIFSDTTAQHTKWQKFHRLVFVSACEDAFEHKIAKTADSELGAYDKWKIMTEAEEFNELELEDMDDIPMNRGSDLLRHRKPRQKVIATIAPINLEGL